MKFLVRIAVFLTFFSPNILFGQGQAGVWYFGENAGLDFNVDPAVALTNGSLNTEEGCSTVCNAQGDLLFYTDGITVYNKNHVVMANGDGLDGNSSATQSSIIVQQPGSAILYYIFTVDAHQNALRNGLNYTIVDLSQNAGLGAVTVKNTVLNGNEVCEKVTAVKHANGTDFWILMHLYDSRDFYAYRLSAAGVGAAVVSTVGVRHNSDRRTAIGYMKTSPNGAKLAVAIYTQDLVELFDFNTNSGVVSNPIQLNNYTTPYGVEFSPSNQYLYISSFTDGDLYQFDISSNNQSTINSSSQVIGSGSWLYGALQLAPDNRIYMAKTNTNGTTGSLNLDVINDPDIAGAGANFVADSKNLAGRRCRLGLPNFVTSIFTLEFAYQFDCLGDNTEFTITSDLANVASATWDFGDGTSLTSNVSPFTVNHIYSSANTYNVNLEVSLISGGTDNVTQAITIRDLPVANDQTVSVVEDSPGSGVATGVDLTSNEAAVNGGAGTTYIWYSDVSLSTVVGTPTNVSVSNGQQFWVEVNDGFCSDVAVVTYTVTSVFILDFAYQFDCLGDNTEFTITSDLTNITSATWDFGDGTNLASNTSPFTVNHVYSSANIYNVNVEVDLISGGTENITKAITIRDLPVANDQAVTVWEDTAGSGIASGVDLTINETTVNGGAGTTYVWYSDVSLATVIGAPTNVSVTNGQQFWVEVNDGFCSSTAVVTYTVNSLPMAVDQNIVLCEDNYNSGVVSNVDLTLLEPAITSNNGFVVTWFHDIALTQPVGTPNNRIVSDGESFYAQVSTGTQTSVATVNYSIETLPEGNSVLVQIWEDSFGSGTASGIDLTSYNTQVAGTNNIVWYQDAAFTNPIVDPSNIVVNDQDVFYGFIDNGVCLNQGSIQFTVRSSPIANDLSLQVCEDTFGSGVTSNVDLLLLNAAVNGGTPSTVDWFSDAGLINAVANPSNVTVSDGQLFYTLVQSGGETNSSVVDYSVNALPIANNQSIVEFEDVPGSMIALGVDLTFYNNLILGGTFNTIEWYSDIALTNLVPNPANHDVNDGDVYYVLVSDGLCSNVAIVDFSVVNTPIARNVFPIICEDVAGSGNANVDLILLENQINEGNGDTFVWYSDWPTEPNGLPINVIPAPTNVIASNGDRFFAAVSDALNTNIGVVDYTILSLPNANDQNVDVWEDSFGTGIASGVNLLAYNSVISNSVGASIFWYSDIALTIPVLAPGNVSVSTGTAFYAIIDDGNCQNQAVLTFNVRNLPEANDLQIQLCEEVMGSGSIVSYDLSQLETAINNDPGTVKEWFFDVGLTLPVPSPMNTTVSDGDIFYVRVSFGVESNVGQVDFRINTLPSAQNYQVQLCEDVYNTLQVVGENLTSYEPNITTSVSGTLIWYSDAAYSTPVLNAQNVLVADGDIFYARIWDGTCENFAELSFDIVSLPQTTTVNESFCEDSFGSRIAANVNLTDYNLQVSNDPNATIQWFEDDQLIIPVADPLNVTVSNQSSFYVLAINSDACENSGRLNFILNPLPEAIDLNLELCEDIAGLGEVRDYDLSNLINQVSTDPSVTVSWYEDIDLLIPVTNPLSYSVLSNSSVFAKVENGCSNIAVVNFLINEKPSFDLGQDTTIFYTETKILSPAIDIQFLPGTYLWQDGSTTSTYTVVDEGKYTLELTDFNGCVGSDSILVYVDRYRIFVPNAFTPDGNGLNDTFGPSITGDITGEDVEMFIYNRWGELIYEFTDLGQGWDGTYKGKMANTGVYVWVLIVNGKARQDGNVSLIR